MLKKILSLFLSVMFVFTLVSCGKTDKAAVDSSKTNKVKLQKELVDPRGKTLEDTSDGKASPQMVETLYETKDVVIADYIPTKMGYAVDPTGATDSTAGIQKALNDCHDAGGGTVYLPAGNYAISDTIEIPPFVTLRGDWQDPDEGTEYGTIISVWMESDDCDTTGIFRLGSCGGVLGLTVYYPLQTLDLILPYPYTFYVPGDGANHTLSTVENVTIINGFRGIGTASITSQECLHVENLKGTFLLTGYACYKSTDVGLAKRVKVSNKYWKEAAADCMNAVDSEAIDAYTKEHTTGLMIGDLDWTFYSDISVDGCAYGIRIVEGQRAYHGCLTDVNITNCAKGIVIDKMNGVFPSSLSKSYIEGGIVNNTESIMKLCGVEVKGKIKELKDDTIMVDDTDLSKYVIDYKASYVKPASKVTVLDLPNGVFNDVAPKVQQALNKAASEGGGVVYIPAGVYCFNTPITIPAGVELRGATSVAQREIYYDNGGTLFLCYYGDDPTNSVEDTAFITLGGDNAGLNGVMITYPENNPIADDTDLRNMYSTYTVRGKGTGVYVVNSMISGSGYGIDFRNCDNHFIQNVTTCCYFNAYRLGGKNGILNGCLQNGSVLARTFTPYRINATGRDNTGLGLVNDTLKVNCSYIIIDNAVNQTVYNTFSYGSKTFSINNNSENTFINNSGSDAFSYDGVLIDMNGGSLTAIGVMRLGGNSYKYNSGVMRLYNSSSHKEQLERTLIKGE